MSRGPRRGPRPLPSAAADPELRRVGAPEYAVRAAREHDDRHVQRLVLVQALVVLLVDRQRDVVVRARGDRERAPREQPVALPQQLDDAAAAGAGARAAEDLNVHVAFAVHAQDRALDGHAAVDPGARPAAAAVARARRGRDAQELAGQRQVVRGVGVADPERALAPVGLPRLAGLVPVLEGALGQVHGDALGLAGGQLGAAEALKRAHGLLHAGDVGPGADIDLRDLSARTVAVGDVEGHV